MIYEQKYKKRVFNTHKSVCDTCPGSYHTISQYLCIYNNNNNLSNETFYYFSEKLYNILPKEKKLIVHTILSSFVQHIVKALILDCSY